MNDTMSRAMYTMECNEQGKQRWQLFLIEVRIEQWAIENR